jgi:hypothetical protein
MHIDAGGLPPLKVTLIPLGRSLQREAGAPDFFRLPRVVAAADGDQQSRPCTTEGPAVSRLSRKGRGDRGHQLQRCRRPLRISGGA